MQDLILSTEHLAELAATQDEAAYRAESGATAAANLKVQVWVSHGVASGFSNDAFTEAEAARRAAGEATKNASADLAQNLRVANAAYASTDEQAAQNLGRQLTTESDAST